MKFKDKNGNMFSDIEAARQAFCPATCMVCPLSSRDNGRGVLCTDFCDCCPDEAARLMGYEVTEDEPTGMFDEYDPPCKWCQDEFCTNGDSPMRADYCPVPFTAFVCKHEEREEKTCEYLDVENGENECVLPNDCGCPHKESDLNPDGSVNIYVCGKTKTPKTKEATWINR